MKKITVAVLCGGQSAEHEVSLHSAQNIWNAIDIEKYNRVFIGITKDGRWLIQGAPEQNMHDIRKYLNNPSSSKNISIKEDALLPMTEQDENNVDIFFPALHGPFGEDGVIQGMLKMKGKRFVGCGVLASACSMDKDITKRLLRDAGIANAKFVTLRKNETPPSYNEMVQQFGSPIFIKPANMGSSVGVHKVCNEKDYESALRDAFSFDKKVIIEEFIDGHELECAVLGNDNPAASCISEVITSHEFYTYDAKYVDADGSRLEIPAKLPPEVSDEIRSIALRVFETLGCAGLSRVDFFLKKDGGIIVNEINTMPGFTNISGYPKMWEASGMTQKELVERLIQLALE
jgi:D-alanine-D-alanine ligase